MAIPKYDELYRSVLKLLSDGKEHRSREMITPIADEFNLTDEERTETLPSQRQATIVNRIGWARTYLKKAGLITSPKRGVFQITQLGLTALNTDIDIDNEYLSQFEAFKAFKQGTITTQTSQDADVQSSQKNTPDEEITNALKVINQELVDDLLEEIMNISDKAFERFVLDLMTSMGYGSVEYGTQVTPYVGDEGIDGIIMEDKLGFDLIYVQAKHYSPDHSVGRPEVQAFVGAIAGRNGKGLFVTTSKFSEPAIEYAQQQHIVLIDGKALANLMIEHDFGVSTRKVYKVKSVDTDLFSSYLDE